MAARKKPKSGSKRPPKPISGPADGNHGQRAASRSIAELRKALDEIDREILHAVSRRGELAQQIGELKNGDGHPPYDHERESKVLRDVVAQNRGPLTPEAVRAIFREIVSASRAVQLPLRAAYLGPEFTFSHLAAIERFGHSAELVPVATIAAVFDEVERGQVQYGVVPMENSTDGRVSDTLECFARSRVRICGELPLRIHHCLLGTAPRDAIKTVYSKPQPLSQCRNWLASHLPSATISQVGSTAAAAKAVRSEPNSAAIASRQASAHYELPLVVENIEDNPDNVTRFAVISSNTGERSGNDKTALMVEIAHQPGALADAMAIFKSNRLNMTWIESFPIPGSRGRYLFFLEFVGHESEPPAKRAISKLAAQSLRLEVLGSYAQTEPVG